MLEGHVLATGPDNGSKDAWYLTMISDEHGRCRILTNLLTLQENGSAERLFTISHATQMVKREQASLLLPDDDISKGIVSIRDRVVSWTVDVFNRICTPGDANFSCQYKVYIEYSEPLKLLPCLALV